MKEKTKCDRWMTGLGHCRANNEEEPCAEDSGALLLFDPAQCVCKLQSQPRHGKQMFRDMRDERDA